VKKILSKIWYDPDFGQPRFIWIVVTFLIGGVILFGGGSFIIVGYAGSLESKSCPKRGIALERETRFVRYNHWDWDCLVQSTNGKWIPLTEVIKVELEQELTR
jgi:hypothetical protein